MSSPALKNLGSVNFAPPSKPRNVRIVNFGPLGKAYHIKDIVKGRYYYPKGAGARFLRPSFMRSPKPGSRWAGGDLPVTPKFKGR